MGMSEGSNQSVFDAIPIDWNVKTIGEISTVGSGGTPNRKNPYFWDGDIPWITTTQINGDTIHRSHQFITQLGLAGSAAKWYPKGTILMAMYGQGKTRGKVAVLGIDATINQACAAIIVSGEVRGEYLLHFLVSKYEDIRELSNSGGQENLNSNLVKSIEVLVPPKIEQIAIASVLDDADAWIQSLTHLIEKKRQIKLGALQTLFSPKENGHVKTGWVVKKLGEIATFSKGKGLPKSHLVSNGEYECVHYGELFTKYKEKITSILSKTNIYDNCVFSQENDVLMPTSDVTPNGLATASCIKKSGVILGGDILIIRPQRNVLNGVYFSYLINVEHHQVMQLVSGSTVYHLYGVDMANFVLSMPKDTAEQANIATVLTDMDSEITVLETKLAKAQQIKQGMMQNLLTGRVRLI